MLQLPPWAEQIPQIQTKYPTYSAFAAAPLLDIYQDMKIETALHYQARNFASGWLIQTSKKEWNFRPLTNTAQIAPIFGTILGDFDQDGHIDLTLAGKLQEAEVETPRADGGRGSVLGGMGREISKAGPPRKLVSMQQATSGN